MEFSIALICKETVIAKKVRPSAFGKEPVTSSNLAWNQL